MSTAHLFRELIELTAQTDRQNLIDHLLGSIHKINRADHSAFYDVVREREIDPGGVEIIKTYLVEPLDTQGRERAAGEEEGVLDCLERVIPVLIERDDPGPADRLLFPIIEKHQVVSLIVQDAPSFDKQAKSALRIIGDIFQNQQRLIRLKDQDPLTGLSNRRSFDETISTILDMKPSRGQMNRKYGDSACLAVLDIDHFKRVNDVFGHAIGDEVLILFARLMEKVFRHKDKLFRFGGEEFLVVLTTVTPETAHAALERFRADLEIYQFPQVDKVTVSIGYVMIEREDFPTVLIEKADKALYYAKENGRNQVCDYDGLVADGRIGNVEHAADDIELWD